MKRLFEMMVTALIMLCLVVVPAAAETVQNATQGIDWTEVLVYVIGTLGTLLTAILARVWVAYVRPWLDMRGLTEAAYIVVDAVEQIVGRGFGVTKWNIAIQKMKDRGFDTNSDKVLDALKAAWIQLDLSQIAAGAKEAVYEGVLLEDVVEAKETAESNETINEEQ